MGIAFAQAMSVSGRACMWSLCRLHTSCPYPPFCLADLYVSFEIDSHVTHRDAPANFSRQSVHFPAPTGMFAYHYFSADDSVLYFVLFHACLFSCTLKSLTVSCSCCFLSTLPRSLCCIIHTDSFISLKSRF